jgi:hypothetical protein
MATLYCTTVIAIAAFLVLMLGMSLTAGTQGSFSQLAKLWRWLLLVALWSQVLLLPQMFDMTPHGWQWMPALGIFAIVVCGGASLYNKEDNMIHMIAAAVAFVCLVGWVMLVNSRCLMPLVVCAMAGRENPVWRIETGMVASVYTLMTIFS